MGRVIKWDPLPPVSMARELVEPLFEKEKSLRAASA